MSSPIPSGFKNREEYNAYMKVYNRNYRKLKNKKLDDLLKRIEELEAKLSGYE